MLNSGLSRKQIHLKNIYGIVLLVILVLIILTTFATETPNKAINAPSNDRSIYFDETALVAQRLKGAWGEPLNGLRMRLTAPAGTIYKRGMSLPLVIEVQNVSEQPIP